MVVDVGPCQGDQAGRQPVGRGGGGQQELGQVYLAVLVDMKDSVKTEEVLDQVFKGVVVGDKGEVVVNSKFQRPKRIMIDRQIW